MISVFVLAMLLHPEVQRRAQEQIDTVVGRERMPTTEDKSDLPYIQALVKELFRWLPDDPLGVPRCSTEARVPGFYLSP